MACNTSAGTEQLSGGWSATIGGRTVGGGWTAEPHEEPDAAWGTWSLLDRSGGRLASGAWGARKAKDEWQGRWEAEVYRCGTYSGSWAARLGIARSSPLIDLFRSAMDEAVSGTWKADRGLAGAWSIRADRGN